MLHQTKVLVLAAAMVGSAYAQSQPAPNVFNVLSWSSVFNQTVLNGSNQVIGVRVKPFNDVTQTGLVWAK